MTVALPRKYLLPLLLLSVLVMTGCHGRQQSGKDFDKAVAPTPAAVQSPAAAKTPAPTAPAPAAVATPAPAAPASPVAAVTQTGPLSPASESLAETPYRPAPDPLYHWNKFWFGFNDLFYSGLMRPFSKGYAFVVPKTVRTGLTNAYQNFIFPIRFLNALLQLDFKKASKEFGRFMINSTLGIGGLVDVAKADPNLPPGNEDFGQTLGRWGIGDGFYIVWPLLGPSSMRDTIGMAGDAAANPLTWIFGPWSIYGDDNPWYWSYIIKGGDVFNNLPNTLEAYDSVVKPAVDPYTAVKDAYFQYRRNAVSQ
jgi:phospholipid-binding lipoprotein MlaA